MGKYNDIKYDIVRKEINKLFKQFNNNVEKVKLLGAEDESVLEGFLKNNNFIYQWNIDKDDWFALVDLEAEVKEGIMIVEEGRGFIYGPGTKLSLKINEKMTHSWGRYKTFVLEDELNFNDMTINNIEKDTYNILSYLNYESPDIEPVKGLVIGGVQSGKTTSMTSLMAAAADYPYNLVIILSGTIENLRVQTESRIQDLISKSNAGRVWQRISRPKNIKNELISDHFNDKKILYSVVLKNKSRLTDLIDWLTLDSNIVGKLNVIVIDDEADQGSINTAKEDKERKTINRLIVNLVHGKTSKGKQLKTKYNTMNYIAYTATPYANILNESPGGESLYPSNFISVLSRSSQHFGPKEIFGLEEDTEYQEESDDNEALDIINEVTSLDEIELILKGEQNYLNKDLKESIAYFVAASASLRLHKFKKPVSMLIHISNRTDDHKKIHDLIYNWLTQNKDELLTISKEVWNRERNRISIDDISKKVTVNVNTSLKPQNFDELKDEILNILEIIQPIGIDEEGKDFIYHKGVHTIIDNSKAKSYEDYDESYRLEYPRLKEDKDITPIFMVIGGATLSRGLTLEGLITSYFLRTPSTADTLTQMGRWFGYRINYELYPRIWMTNNTKRQFSYISTLEYELRNEIEMMNEISNDFSLIGPKIKYSPQYINIVAKNKSQRMKAQEYNFTGFTTQSTIFDVDRDIQNYNIRLSEDFINDLGYPKIIHHGRRDGIFWENIPFSKIYEQFLSKFKFNKKTKSLNTLDALNNWIEQITNKGLLNNFNIILGGKGKIDEDGADWNLKHFKYNMVNRSKVKSKSDYSKEISIKGLRGPGDVYLDIDIDKIEDKETLKLVKGSSSNYINANHIRTLVGMEKTPQLFIYKIDKDSKASKKSVSREDLNFETDIIGVYINIPNGEKNISYTTYVTVAIKEPNFDIDELDSKGNDNDEN